MDRMERALLRRVRITVADAVGRCQLDLDGSPESGSAISSAKRTTTAYIAMGNQITGDGDWRVVGMLPR